jgi:hypothetical protein
MTFDSVTELEKINAALDGLGEKERSKVVKPDMVLRLRVPDDHSVFKLG